MDADATFDGADLVAIASTSSIVPASILTHTGVVRLLNISTKVLLAQQV
jgi:hypothetical protein